MSSRKRDYTVAMNSDCDLWNNSALWKELDALSRKHIASITSSLSVIWKQSDATEATTDTTKQERPMEASGHF